MTESEICWAIFAWIGVCWLWRVGKEKLRVFMEGKEPKEIVRPGDCADLVFSEDGNYLYGLLDGRIYKYSVSEPHDYHSEITFIGEERK